MPRRSANRNEEAHRLDIISGLLALKRDGHFETIWATDTILKVKYSVYGPIVMLSWKKAATMVTNHRNAGAAALAAEMEAERKGPGSERATRAQTASAGQS